MKTKKGFYYDKSMKKCINIKGQNFRSALAWLPLSPTEVISWNIELFILHSMLCELFLLHFYV